MGSRKPLTFLAVAALALAVAGDVLGADLPLVPGLRLSEITIPSSMDGKDQLVVIGVPEVYAEGKATALLVGLHTWSSDGRQMAGTYGNEAMKRGWLLVLPQFRGPMAGATSDPREGGGSILAQRDVMDAIAYMRAAYTVAPRRIYMVGASGGGHMACLMACKYPDVFAAVTAWCPITDLREWYAQGDSYAANIEAICGGKPGATPEVDFEYLRRSPRSFITNAAGTHLLIGHGDRDETVYPEQSWNTFRELRSLPQHGVVFDCWSGGHEAKTTEGLEWASRWWLSTDPPSRLDLVTDEAKAYFWLHLTPSGPLTLGKCTAILVRKGDALEPGKLAEATSLTLDTTDLAQVRVALKALNLRAPEALPEGITLEGGALVLRPGAGHRQFRVDLLAPQ